MAGERRLTVVLAGDSKGLTSALGQAEKSTGRFGSKLGGLSTKAKVAFAGATTAAFAFGKSSVNAFVESEAAQTRLEDAFAKFPQLAGGNIAALQKLNEQLALKTRFDDDATASGQAVLAQFGLTQKQLTDITPLLQDYAARTGKDLPAAAQDLGKAVLGQGRALKSVGLNLKDTGSKAGNLEQLMGGLRSQVQGFAEKEGTTAAGKAAILSNQFGELQEQVGAKLVPALTKLATVGLSIVSWLSNLSPGMQMAVGIAAGLAAGLFTIVKAVQAWTAVQGALNVVLSMNPIGLIIIAVAAFVAGIVIAYQKVGWFRDLVDGAFRLIKTVIMTAFNWVKNNWPLLLGILTGPIGLAVVAITKNWDKIKAGAAAVKDFVVGRFNALLSFFSGLRGRIAGIASNTWNALKNGLSSAINWILDQLDRLLGPLDEIAGKVGGVVGKVGGLVGKIPGFATGVTNFRGGLAVVGERGPELVNLPRGSDVIPMSGTVGAASGGPSIVVDLRGSFVASGIEFERIVRKAIADTVGRNGKIPGTNIVRATP